MADLVYDGFISYSHAADGLLAPRLQAGLQRFAKPWWKRRAVRIFRDESSLSANPHLWSSITDALDASGWFVLLLSPDAAASEWVNQEIAYWKTHRDPSRILPVVTDGEFGWSGGDVTGDAVPEQLRGVFSEEPRWVDLRFARDEEQLDLKNARFAAAIADIASALRGVPKDELESEEVRQHRRTIRTAWAAGGLVTVLAIAAIGLGIQSERNERLAVSREAAASAINVLDDDPELAVLLGLQALRSAPSGDEPPREVRIALRQAVQSNYLNARHTLDGAAPYFGDLSPDGSRLVVATAETVSMYRLEPWSHSWTLSVSDFHRMLGTPSPPCLGEAVISTEGHEVMVSLQDERSEVCPDDVVEDEVDGSAIVVLAAESGEYLRSTVTGACPGVVLGPQSPDGATIPVVTSDAPDCEATSEGWFIALYDAVTLERVRTLPVPGIGMISWAEEAGYVSFGSFRGEGWVVYDANTGMEISSSDALDLVFGWLSPDGRQIALSDLNFGLHVYDVATGQLRDRLYDLGAGPTWVDYSEDGSTLVAGGRGSQSAVWDAETGQLVDLIPNTGPVVVLEYDDATETLVHVGPRAVSTWSLSAEIPGGGTAVHIGPFIQANSVVANEHAGVVMVRYPEAQLRGFDPATGEMLGTELDVSDGRRNTVLADGRVVAFPRSEEEEELLLGPVVAWDPLTGTVEEFWGCVARDAELVSTGGLGRALEGPCADGSGEFFPYDRAFVSADGSHLAVSSQNEELLLFDPRTLQLISRAELPDGAEAMKGIGSDWIVVSDTATGVGNAQEVISLIDLETHEVRASLPGTRVDSDRTGSLLAVHSGPGTVTVLDTATGGVVAELVGGTAQIRGIAFSQDSTRLMTSGTDGFVRIWDLATGLEVDRLPLADGESGDGYWIDDETIVIGTLSGIWTTLSLDLDVLVDVAVTRLTRSFTTQECVTYRIEPCPTLEELRGS